MTSLAYLKNFLVAGRARRKGAAGASAARHSTHRSRWWILFWVVLITGGYFWYSSARRLQVPIRVQGLGLENPEFYDMLGPLLGADFSKGNSVKTLINGDNFFPAMLEAIRGAQKTITLETYIWAPGKISDQFIEALGERARAGVKVHVLMDGMGTLKFRHEDRIRMEKDGIEVLTYGREHWYQIKADISHRTHRKLLIVDGRIGFTGGMCIDDSWLGNADSEKVWRETQVRVEGPVVLQMQAVFATNWLQTTSKLLVGPDYFPRVQVEGSSLMQCIKSGPGEGLENIRMSYLCAIAASRKEIDIGNAYFVPDDLAIQMLLDARKRGVRVRIVVPAINDSKIGRSVSRSRWGKLLAAGAEIYEYLPAMYHAKTMVADGIFVTVGSANFDNRSFSINDEVAVNIADAGVAREHLKIFEDDLKRSRQVTLEQFRSRPLYIKILDHFWGVFRSQF